MENSFVEFKETATDLGDEKFLIKFQQKEHNSFLRFKIQDHQNKLSETDTYKMTWILNRGPYFTQGKD